MRRTLRSRSRYEYDNNGYASGIIRTLANDMVGTGPTLQILPDDPAPAPTDGDQGGATAAELIERAFGRWAKACRLAQKLHTMSQAKARDGEAFALLTTNPKLDDPVKLDLFLIEADQVAHPFGAVLPIPGVPWWYDGIDYDAAGNPTSYTVLDYHPGDLFWGWTPEYKTYKAEYVLHWYRCDRPGQKRGVPELTSALPLFAVLRRWTLASLSAAETAANFSAVLQTPAPPDGETDEPTPFETLEIERNTMTTLPAGTTLNQFHAEQPTTVYSDFKGEVLGECGRPLQMPRNIVTGNSGTYNFSSAKLDHYGYRGGLRVDRSFADDDLMERIFAAWYAEGRLIPGYLPAGVNVLSLRRAWYWPGWPSIDKNDAKDDTERLSNGTTTLSEILAEYGQDWREFVRQRGRELKVMEQNGVPAAPAAPAGPGGGGAPFGAEQAVAICTAVVGAIRAGDREYVRDDHGQFAETGGGDSHDPPKEMSDRWDREDSATAETRGREDAAVEHDRAVEDANLAHEEREIDQQEALVDRDRKKEDREADRDDDREDRAFDKKWDREEASIEKARDKEAAKFEKSIAHLPEKEQEQRWEQYRQEREEKEGKEDQDFAERKGAERDQIDQAREKRDDEVRERRQREDADFDRRREGIAKRGREMDANREAEDQAIEDRRKAEDHTTEARRDREYEQHSRGQTGGRAADIPKSVRDAEPIVYHGAHSAAVESIRKEGIRPSDGSYGVAAYTTDSYAEAIDYGMQSTYGVTGVPKPGEILAVVQVRPDATSSVKKEGGFNQFGGKFPQWSIFPKGVAPSAIVRIDKYDARKLYDHATKSSNKPFGALIGNLTREEIQQFAVDASGGSRATYVFLLIKPAPAQRPTSGGKASAFAPHRIRAGDREYVRDDHGQFAETGGGGDSGGSDPAKDAAREREDQEHHQRQAREDKDALQRQVAEHKAVEVKREIADRLIVRERDKEDAAHDKRVESRDKEDETVQKGRDKEDAATEKAREKEDASIEKARDREDAQADPRREKEDKATAKAREKEDAADVAQRDKEDAATERQQIAEDKATQAARDKEDRDRQAASDKEDAAIAQVREKEDAEHDARPDGPEKDQAREELDAKREDEDTALQERRDTEDQAIQDARDTADEETEAKREAEAAAIQEQRDQKDADDVERRAAEDEATGAAREAEDKAVQDARDKEDTDREAQREAEDKAVQEQRDKEDEAVQAQRDKEDAEREALEQKREDEDQALQDRRDAEDAEREARHEREDEEQNARHEAELERLDALRKKEDEAAAKGRASAAFHRRISAGGDDRPRVPAGSPEGGQFAPKDGGDSGGGSGGHDREAREQRDLTRSQNAENKSAREKARHEDRETAQRWAREDKATAERRRHEDRDLAGRRALEDLHDEHAVVAPDRTDQREQEDAARKEQREQEDKRREKARDAEQNAVTERRDKEDAEREKRHDRQWKDFDQRHNPPSRPAKASATVNGHANGKGGR